MRFDRTQTSRDRDLRWTGILPTLAALALLTGCNQNGASTGSAAASSQTGTSTTGSAPLPQPATASVTLSWTPSVENTDGSALTDLAGYFIHYGNIDGQPTNTIKIETPGMTTYTVDNLASGDWYFSIRAYNSAGVESAPSATASTSI